MLGPVNVYRLDCFDNPAKVTETDAIFISFLTAMELIAPSHIYVSLVTHYGINYGVSSYCTIKLNFSLEGLWIG